VLSLKSPALWATTHALSCIKHVQIHAVVGSSVDSRYGTRLHKSITVLPPGPRSDEDVVRAILALASTVGAEAFIPVWAEDVAFVSRCRDALAPACPVALPENGLLEQLQDKYRFYCLAKSLGMSVPDSVALEPGMGAEDLVEKLGLPLLAKPRQGCSGKGIVAFSDKEALSRYLDRADTHANMLLQKRVQGADVALTLLADAGDVFAVVLRKRWYTRANTSPFYPIHDVEFFHDEWLESLGRDFVKATHFSGIADFDLKVDFESRSAWFLESDPRMVGGLPECVEFGVNLPWLLVEKRRGQLPEGTIVRNQVGHFLSPGSIPSWILSRSWDLPRRGPIRSAWKFYAKDPLGSIRRHLAPAGF
jgi:predicted ATP-grasp superfamily ATP-dependent carboligase